MRSDTRSAAYSASFASTTARIRHSSSRCCAITSARPRSSERAPSMLKPALKIHKLANVGESQPVMR